MGWFNKKDKGNENKNFPQRNEGDNPPELPKLPELPPLKENKKSDPNQRLPRMPQSSFGDKFSQNTIKDAVSRDSHEKYPGEKEGKRVVEADDFGASQSNRPMHKPSEPKNITDFPKTEEIGEDNFENFDETDFDEDFETPEFEEPSFKTKESFTPPKSSSKEPVFIRIDKFEEAMKAFEKTKKTMAEIEKTLKEIGDTREEEEKELENWKSQVVKVKDQIEKVDNDIFSKIE